MRAVMLLAALASAVALYDASDAVVALDDKTFDKKTKEGVWLVEVYANWCVNMRLMHFIAWM